MIRKTTVLVTFVLQALTLNTDCGVNVGTLSSHDPLAWEISGFECSQQDVATLALVKCNLKVMDAAVNAASQAKVDLLVLPEGYALIKTPKKEGYFDTIDNLDDLVGTEPCRSINPNESDKFIQVFSLSCMARKY